MTKEVFVQPQRRRTSPLPTLMTNKIAAAARKEHQIEHVACIIFRLFSSKLKMSRLRLAKAHPRFDPVRVDGFESVQTGLSNGFVHFVG